MAGHEAESYAMCEGAGLGHPGGSWWVVSPT